MKKCPYEKSPWSKTQAIVDEVRRKSRFWTPAYRAELLRKGMEIVNSGKRPKATTKKKVGTK